MQLVMLLLASLWPVDGVARMRAVRHPGAIPTPQSVLWVAAHPDDEAVAAPLLAKWCLQERARCGFLVLTRGESGACLRPDGCLPDVASVRSSEAGSASQLFRADSIHLRFPDGGGSAPPPWHLPREGPDIISSVASHIEAFRPDLILTFDPRHGTTCHPDHRETGTIVLESVKRLSFDPVLYFLETRIGISTDPLTIRLWSAAATAQRLDATQFLPAMGASAWDAIVHDMQRHRSQFDERWIAAIESVPHQERAVFIAPAEYVLQQQVQTCP